MSELLIVIGENINATRKIRITSPRIVDYDGNKKGIKYKTLGGQEKHLDLTEILKNEAVVQSQQVPHIGAAILNEDKEYLWAAVKEQVDGGADIVDLCVDEVTPYPEKRHEYMQWLITTVQEKISTRYTIDSSDPDTIEAGLKVYDSSKGRAVLNSTNLEDNRQKVIDLAKETKSQIIANASGQAGMPENDKERFDNLVELMNRMEKAGIPVEDRFLDALVFPIGAGSEFGKHFLNACKSIRDKYGDGVHIFGGFSNVSFGLPNRRLINETLAMLSILHGCDSMMIDPKQINVKKLIEFKLAADALLGKDEYCMKMIEYMRAQ